MAKDKSTKDLEKIKKGKKGKGKKNKDKKKKGSLVPQHDHSKVLMEDGSINISQSKVKTWRACHRAYHNKFVLGIFLRKIKRPFMFGSIIHEMIDAHYNGKDAFEVLNLIDLDFRPMFRKEREMYGDIITDIRFIMEDYFNYWEGQVEPLKGPGGLFAEHEFRIELDDGLWFTGKLDGVIKAKRMRWLDEHKSFSRMPSEDDRWRSVQGASYIRAIELLNWKNFGDIDGISWDYISSKPLQVPTEVLKNGTYSLKKIDTLPNRLEAWLKEEIKKKEREHYKKLMDEAQANRRSHFIRLYSPLRPRVVDNIWSDFVDTAKEIQDNHGKRKDQNIGFGCRMCDYQALCRAQAHGQDEEYVLKTLYTKEERKSLLAAPDRTDDS